jgi:predicted nucleotidyltransferase
MRRNLLWNRQYWEGDRLINEGTLRRQIEKAVREAEKGSNRILGVYLVGSVLACRYQIFRSKHPRDFDLYIWVLKLEVGNRQHEEYIRLIGEVFRNEVKTPEEVFGGGDLPLDLLIYNGHPLSDYAQEDAGLRIWRFYELYELDPREIRDSYKREKIDIRLYGPPGI